MQRRPSPQWYGVMYTTTVPSNKLAQATPKVCLAAFAIPYLPTRQRGAVVPVRCWQRELGIPLSTIASVLPLRFLTIRISIAAMRQHRTATLPRTSARCSSRCNLLTSESLRRVKISRLGFSTDTWQTAMPASHRRRPGVQGRAPGQGRGAGAAPRYVAGISPRCGPGENLRPRGQWVRSSPCNEHGEWSHPCGREPTHPPT